MTAAGQRSFVDELEEQAARRFAKWDSRSWSELLAGPAIDLDDRLTRSAATPEESEAVLRTYLRLGAEGIGLGYLFPAAEAGVENFFTLAWTRLLPQRLPELSAARMTEVLAQCWNLGENLEATDPWIGRVFHRSFQELTDLSGLEGKVEEIAAEVFEPPPKRLRKRFDARWLHLAGEDPRFLPGELHFRAPTVLCVHDRHRTTSSGERPLSCGAWLGDPPLLLGPMDCEDEAPKAGPRPEFLKELTSQDPRFCNPHSWIVNGWRGAATMKTSQFLVVLLPP